MLFFEGSRYLPNIGIPFREYDYGSTVKEFLKTEYVNVLQQSTLFDGPTSDKYFELLVSEKNKIAGHIYNNALKNQDENWTVYTGKGGQAFLFFNIWYSNKDLKEHQDDYLTMAVELLEMALADHGSSKSLSKQGGFYLTSTGLWALATVIYSYASPKKLEHYFNLLINARDLVMKNKDMEVLYGRSGYVYALNFVVSKCHRVVLDDLKLGQLNFLIKTIIHGILHEGRKNSQDLLDSSREIPLLWSWHEKYYLGAAHGITGILIIILASDSKFHTETGKRFLEANDQRDIHQMIFWLVYISQNLPSGGFPSSLGEEFLQSSNISHLHKRDLYQWCHGTPGLILLLITYCDWLLSYDENVNIHEYIHVMDQLGNGLWKLGILTKGVGLCHGISGNAYVFLSLANFASKRKLAELGERYLNRAKAFFRVAYQWEVLTRKHLLRVPDAPYSLMEGLGGYLMLINDMYLFLKGCHGNLFGFPGMLDVF